MHLPTQEQIEAVCITVAAGAAALGLVGTGIEQAGAAVSKFAPKLGGALIKFGQALEDIGTNVPRLLGKEKR